MKGLCRFIPRWMSWFHDGDFAAEARTGAHLIDGGMRKLIFGPCRRCGQEVCSG